MASRPGARASRKAAMEPLATEPPATEPPAAELPVAKPRAAKLPAGKPLAGKPPARRSPPAAAATEPPLQVRRPVRRSRANLPYVLDEHVGFILRQVGQRHAAIFAARIGDDLTMTQWAALAKLNETGPCSQNLLGRLTAMDAATIKGVVDRLVRRGFVETRPDTEDGRLLVVVPTAAGEEAVARATQNAFAITEETLAPLDAAERAMLLKLLDRLR